jgi:hypothetical protein
MNNNHLCRPKKRKFNRKLLNAHARAMLQMRLTKRGAEDWVKHHRYLNTEAFYTKLVRMEADGSLLRSFGL